MVAVLVHEVVGVAFVLLPHLLHDLLHVLLCEVGAAQDDGFSEERPTKKRHKRFHGSQF